VFQRDMKQKPIRIDDTKTSLMVTERKIVPIYVDSGEVIDGEKVGSIKLKVIETKIDGQAYINSFADECGVKNVMRRFAMTGDPSLFAQHQVIENVDATELPKMTQEELYALLPDELKKGRTFEEFVKTCTADELKAYTEGVISAYKVEEEPKKMEVTENE